MYIFLGKSDEILILAPNCLWILDIKSLNTTISTRVQHLDTSKATQPGDILTKIIKDNKDLFLYFISASFNNAVNKDVFPNELKQADIKPIEKERDQEMKKKIIDL